MPDRLIVLGIETSCDETAAAVYSTRGGILASRLFSQTELHKNYGGVVPEIASRAQIEKITGVVAETLSAAQIDLSAIDAIAVANTPGLAGSLLVGVCFAKALAYAAGKKLVGVNHLEAHIFSALLEHDVPFPHICMTASGGHTALYRVTGFGEYELLGQTTDDAAGETFDKVAKMLGYPYPGGPIIEKLAGEVGFRDFCRYPRQKNPRGSGKELLFSFSGLKTAVLYDLVKKGKYDLHEKHFIADPAACSAAPVISGDMRCESPADHIIRQQVASSLLVCVADMFADRVQQALEKYPDTRAVTFVGGVACNTYIGERLKAVAARRHIPLFIPSPRYCTDNGAMVAFVGHYKALHSRFADMSLDVLF